MSDVKSFSFDFNVAKKKLSNDAIVDYLRNTAHTNINWNFFNNQDNNQIVDSLSANSDGIEIYDVGQEALREDMQERAKNLYAQKDTQGEKILNFFGDMFHTQDSKARKRQEEDLERNLKYLDINALDDEGANALANALSLQTLDKDTGKLLSAKDSLTQRKNALLQKDEILNTQNYHDLSAEQKKVVDDEVGAVENFFRDYVPFVDNREKNFKEWQQVERNREFVNSELLPKIEALKSETFRIADLLSNDTEKRAKAQGFLDDVVKIAQAFGFDDAGYDKDSNLYIGKDGEFYRVNENFFDNFLNTISATKFELGGSLAGGIYGLKAGKNAGKLGALGGAIAGAALGAMGGSVADSIVNHYLLDKDAGAKDIIHKSLEAGALSVVGDIALLGLSKIPLKSTIHKATNAAKFVMDSNIFTGTAKNYLHGQNIQAAQDLLNASVNAEQQAAIKAFAKEFGGDIKKFDKQRVTPQIEQAFGADSVITKTAQKLDDLLIRNDKGNAQRELLEIIRSDDSSLSLGLLLEVAQESPTANKALRDLLKATTINLEKQLETLNISPQTAFTIFRDLQVGTKESYNQAINEVLNELYQDKRTILNRAPYDKLRADLEQNILLGQNELNFLKFVENNIFNPQGVTFSQLNNAKKILNSFYKDVQGGTKDYLKNVVEKDLKQQIDNAIFEIFKTEPKLYGEAKNLYENALSDYATMANTIKTLKKIGFDKSTKTQEEALNTLIKYAKGGGGIAEIPNYAELTKGLSEANKQSLELSALQQIFTESLIGDESFKVFDSKAFFKKLGNLENVFNTQGAKEYIGFLRGFDKLFHNDAEIALRLGFASPKQEGSSIATSLQGAMQQKFIKGVFATLIRNLPHNSIIIKGLGFSEKVQGAALRYHLRRALEKSQDINDFKYHFSQKATHYPFNNATKEIIKRITNDVLEAINNESPNELKFKTMYKENGDLNNNEAITQAIKEFGENYPQFYHKGSEAIEHLLQKRSGQVQGAFYREDLGDITLIWGNEGTGKSDGYGLSKIAKYHPEVLEKLEDLVTNLPIIKETPNRYQLENENYKIAIRKDFEGQNENWILTAFEKKESIARRRTDLPSSQSEAKKTTLANTQGNIIPHSKPFASTKANFTKEQWQNLTTQEKIKAFKDQRAREKAQIAEAQAQEQAKRIAAHQEKRNAIQAQKDSNAGKAINEVDLNLGDSIEYTHLKPTRINLENKDYPAEFVIINKEDLKPNFNTTGTQGRTQKQDNVIQDIQNNLKPNKLFFSEGGFDGLPIVLQDGSIAVGNHRAQALKNLSKESLEAYKKSAKEVFNVDLKDNELIVRMLDKDTPKQEILNLSFASNTGREQNLSEKALSTIGKYQDALKRLPSNIEAQSVEEMQSIVSRTLDPTNNGLNIFDTNLALLTSLAKSKDKNILEALNSISGDAEQKARITKMFVDNAGSFHNIAKQTQMPNLDLRNYLNQIIYFTANAKESRAQNFQELIAAIESLLKTTDAKGSNALLEQNPTYYDDLIGKIVGYSFARFKELENPSRAMFEFLNNIQDTLRQELEPTLFKEGRPLSSADIYDFASVSIKSGIPSDETSKLLDLLPQLKQKQEAFGAKNEPLGNSEKLKSVSKQNLHTENAVVKENLTTEAQKETESQGIPQAIKDIIDTSAQKGRDMQVIGKENFTPEVVEYVQQQNKKVAIEKLSQEEAEALGFKYPQDVRVTIDYQAINHTLNRHGAESNLVKQSGQKAVSYDDIAKYREYAKNADETLQSVDNGGSNVLVSYKQVNGHFVVVEQIKHKNNELGFKTLFKEKGSYKDSKSYKDTKAKAQTLSIGYEPSANSFALAKSLNSSDIIPQNRTLQNTSLDNLTQEIAQLNKQAGELNKRYHQAKDITEKRRLESEYTKTLDKIYSLRAQHPDEIIDVEFIAKEPDITKRIEYKRHNQRAKQIQEINTQLEQIDKEATSNLLNGDALENLINRYKLLESKKAKLREKQLQVRGNTMPTYKPDEIIDVEIIQNYITHTPRNKLREDLSDLTTLYPQLFLDKASVLTNTLRMLNNPKLLNAPQNPQQEIIKETLAQKSGAYKQGSRFDEKDLAEIPQTKLQSNHHLGAGLASGSVAGFETDEQGNLNFNPTNFLLGLAGGAVGSKAISKAVAKATELRLNKLSKAYPKIATHNPELFKEVFKKDIAFLARKGSYNALTSFFNKHKMLDLNPQFFAGEKALLSGEFKPQAQRLQRAKDMLKAGKSDDEIWEKTGWFKGLDDKWRFEINPDFQVSYIKTKLKQSQVLHMRDILQGENKALLKAYPELLEYEIIGSYSKDFSGAISSKDKVIAISTQLNKFQTNATLAHEIQHAIQEIEGFAKGSNLNEANQIFQDYYRTAGEVEARAVEKRALDLAFKREELEAKESTQSLKSLAEQGNPQAKEILELYDKKNAIFNEFKKAHNALQELKKKGYDDSTKEMQEANQKFNKLKEAFTEHLNLIPERINGKPYDIDSTAYELKKDADLILKEYNQIKNTNPQKSYDTPKENVIISKHNIESKGYEDSTHYKLNPQQKEQRGLYNVTYNGKNATLIKRDLEAVDEALAVYTKGFHKGKNGLGAKHIRIDHLQDPTKQGYITDLELMNIGKSMREFLQRHKEPFTETLKNGNKAHIYEWEKDKVRFRVAVEYRTGGGTHTHSRPNDNKIITFYSDRNLKERMKFKNPKVQEAYEKEINKELIPQIQAKFKFDEKKAKDLAEIPQTKLQSNVHIGNGLASGSVAGFETDEQGNLSFNPTNFLLGLAGGALGSKAVAQGFKAISKNPEFKEKVTKELADTLSKGWDSAVKQYPILESLQPRYIVKNEKGRIAQSKAILKEVETKAGKLEKAFLLENRLNTDALEKEAIELPKELEWRDFKKQFEAKGMKVAIDTPIGKVNINVYKAYAHFTNNTYKKDRRKFSGAFLDTLTNPLFVVKQKYRPEVSQVAKKANAMRSNNALVSKIQNKTRLQTGNDEIIQDSYVFYKPFKDDKGLVHLASFAIAQNGELLHKTFYDIKNLSKLQRILKSKDENVIYFKGEQ